MYLSFLLYLFISATPVGTVITLEASVKCDGFQTTSATTSMIVVSPLYKVLNTVYTERPSSLLNGLRRKVILRTGRTLIGVQTINGDLFVDGNVISKEKWK